MINWHMKHNNNLDKLIINPLYGSMLDSNSKDQKCLQKIFF